MKILISSYYLDLSGTPTYTLTLYNELVRRQHRVAVYSPMMGALAARMNANLDLDAFSKPDVIIAQQNECAYSLRAKFPDVPMIFSAHHPTYELEQPPAIDVQAYTAINEDVRDNLISKGVFPPKITIVRDFVNTYEFRPIDTPREKARRVLYISNFKKWKTYDVISGACKKLNLELKARGAPYGRSHDIAKDINEADLVITTARGIIEAMACGRPVISYDKQRGDGYLTAERYYKSRTRNFAGENCPYQFDVQGLAGEIERYEASDGGWNRAIAVGHHNHIQGTNKLLDIIQRIT